MEYSPPPLFKQGASARAKVVFFALIALVLLVVDSRMRSLSFVRQVVATTLYPLQSAAMLPRDGLYFIGTYLSSVSTLERENNLLKQQQAVNAQQLQRSQLLLAENTQLRKLLGASAQLPVKSLMSEILYDARDVFTRKIILNHGTLHGVELGHPVIDDIGVVGQVTRVFPFTAEVTLLTDKDQAIPVQVVRNGLRSVAYGRGQSGLLDLRFIASNADMQKGDLLVTSGIDGVYPPGLAVAKVVNVESKSSDAFARIECQPLAGIDRNRQLLILLAAANTTARPAPDDLRDKKDKKLKKQPEAPAADAAVPVPVVKDVAKPVVKEPVNTPAANASTPANPVAPVKQAVP